MRIWKQDLTLDEIRRIHVDTAPEHMGMEFLEVGDDFVRGRLPVDRRTKQPFGRLHGGASVLLAETLGSLASAYTVDKGHSTVGLDINANHVRGATQGWVTGVARPVHLGRSTQVWQIDISDDEGRLVCVSRLTMAVLSPRG